MGALLIQNPGSAILVFAGVVTLLGGFVVYARDRRKLSNIFFLVLITFVALWGISLGFFEAVSAGEPERVLVSLVYFFPLGIAVSLFFFSLTLSTEKIPFAPPWQFLAILSYVSAMVITLMPEFIIAGIGGKDGGAKEILFGRGFIYYELFILFYLLVSVGILVKRYIEGAGIFKRELRNILATTFVAVLLGVMTNLILPLFGSFYLFWTGPLIAMLAILIIGFHIVKYSFWNVKLVATEFFAILIVVALLFETALSTSLADIFVKILVTILMAVASVFLVRSVRRETEAKNEVERLLKDLAATNRELQILDQRKSEFLSVASHHLRDPLTAITGYASMLLEGTFGPLSANLRDAVQRIYESSRRLVIIINDFLNISQIEQGEMHYVFAPIDMRKIVADITEELGPAASRAGLKLGFEVHDEPGKPFIVSADESKLRQVVSNLVDNSIKYTPQGGVNVALARRRDEEGGAEYIRLIISDTGIGMTRETLAKIFNKFSRAEGVNKLFTDGSGLGLYVAREILKKHNGRIWADSEGLGKGSQFYVELPA